MAKHDHIDIKPFFYLGLGLLAWWLLPVGIRSFFKTAFSEFQAPLILTQSHTQDLQRYWENFSLRSRHDMIAINRDLMRINNGYALERQELLALSRENKRLAELLDMPDSTQYRTLVARVARRDLNTWWQRLVLRRGTADGVREGCPVVSSVGVVGRVVKVLANTCEVQLVSDPNFRVSANVEGEDRAVIYQGIKNAPFDPPKGMVTHILGDFSEDTRERVIYTSGTGGVFPSGLVIGRATGGFVKTPDGLFFESEVRISADLASLEEAAIMIPLETPPPPARP